MNALTSAETRPNTRLSAYTHTSRGIGSPSERRQHKQPVCRSARTGPRRGVDGPRDKPLLPGVQVLGIGSGGDIGALDALDQAIGWLDNVRRLTLDYDRVMATLPPSLCSPRARAGYKKSSILIGGVGMVALARNRRHQSG